MAAEQRPSLPGLTRQSIRFARSFYEEGWTPGSSPGVTHVASAPAPAPVANPTAARALSWARPTGPRPMLKAPMLLAAVLVVCVASSADARRRHQDRKST